MFTCQKYFLYSRRRTSSMPVHAWFFDSIINSFCSLFCLLCYSTVWLFVRRRLFFVYVCFDLNVQIWICFREVIALNDFCVAWRTALRRIWRLLRNSHSRLVPLIANYCLPLLDCICRRFLGFADSCVNSESPLACVSPFVTGFSPFWCLPSLVA